MTTTPQRIDETSDRLNKARQGLAEIDGGEEILKRRGNPKGVHTWTLYGTYADAILLVNAKEDIACLLGEVERLSAERTQPEHPEPTDAEIEATFPAWLSSQHERQVAMSECKPRRCWWCGKERRHFSDWEQRPFGVREWMRLCEPCATKRLNQPLSGLLGMRKIGDDDE